VNHRVGAKLDTIEQSVCLGRCHSFLASQGLIVGEIANLEDVPRLVEVSQKTYVTPLLSVLENDFTRKNVKWIMAEDSSGEPAMLVACRREDLGGEPVSKYWSRILKRHYGEKNQEVINAINPIIDSVLFGDLAYFGDLWVSPSCRGNRSNLRAFATIAQIAIQQAWEPQFTYSFIRERDCMRGAPYVYGFTKIIQNPFNWLNPLPPRANSEQCAYLPRHCFDDMVLNSISHLGNGS